QLNRLDADAAKKTKAKLRELKSKGIITEAQVATLFDMDPDDDGFNTAWDAEVAKVASEHTDEMKTLLTLKKKEASEVHGYDEDFKKKMHEIREIAQELNGQILSKAHQEHALRELQRQCGFPLVKGQVLRYMHLKSILDAKGDVKDFESMEQDLTIEDVSFEEIEIRDENGVTHKQPSITPSITISWTEGGQKQTKTLDGGKFKQMVDIHDISENIRTAADLTQAIGTEVQEGETLEFRETQMSVKGTPTGRDKSVKIEKIDAKAATVTLSAEVVTATFPGVRKQNTLSFGEFAKWYKRNLVEKPIKSLDDLRAQLKAENDARNSDYNRSGDQYPPIGLTPGEVLAFGSIPASIFVIKSVTDDEIELQNGSTYTPSSFLRWVKEKEVERKTDDSEAHIATDNIKDPQERANAFAEEKKKVKKALEDRIKNGEDPPEGFVYDNDEEGSTPSTSYLKKLWNETYFLSCDDFWEAGKVFVEFWKRRWGRRGKNKIGAVGEAAFGGLTGAEYKRVRQASENEEVNNFKEAYANYGIDELKGKLYNTNNRDELKAVIEVLAEKGQLRWEDEKFHATLNRLAHGSPCDVRKSTHINDIEKIIDSWWGNDSFREYRNKNDSSYNSIREAFKDNAKRLENDPEGNGGLTFALSNLMYKFLQGEYVNPAQYESYLYYAIQAGKLSFENKLYFMIMGLGAVGPNGMPLLCIDRVASVEGDLLNNFPILDYFVDPAMQKYDENGKKIKDQKGNPATQKPNVNYFRMLVDSYCTDGGLHSINKAGDCVASPKFAAFADKEIMWNEYAHIRLAEKAQRDISKWDHDDFHKFAPILSDEAIDTIAKLRGGAEAQASVAGLKNAYVGMNDAAKKTMGYFQDAVARGDEAEARRWLFKMMKTMRAFVRMDAILDRRFHHDAGNYTRFSSADYKSNAGVDKLRSVMDHTSELRNFIGMMCDESGLGQDWATVSRRFTSAEKDTYTGRKGWDAQKDLVANFGDSFEKSVSGQIADANGKVDLARAAAFLNNINGRSPLLGIQQFEDPKLEAGEVEKAQLTKFSLTAPDAEQIQNIVGQIKDYRAGRGETRTQRDARKKSRVDKVMSLAEQGKFGQISTTDVGLLQAELQRLESAGPTAAAA
ncbi:hypothetical protein ACFL2V_13030, partial [Pseudomonadota bacterium]